MFLKLLCHNISNHAIDHLGKNIVSEGCIYLSYFLILSSVVTSSPCFE